MPKGTYKVQAKRALVGWSTRWETGNIPETNKIIKQIARDLDSSELAKYRITATGLSKYRYGDNGEFEEPKNARYWEYPVSFTVAEWLSAPKGVRKGQIWYQVWVEHGRPMDTSDWKRIHSKVSSQLHAFEEQLYSE